MLKTSITYKQTTTHTDRLQHHRPHHDPDLKRIGIDNDDEKKNDDIQMTNRGNIITTSTATTNRPRSEKPTNEMLGEQNEWKSNEREKLNGRV